VGAGEAGDRRRARARARARDPGRQAAGRCRTRGRRDRRLDIGSAGLHAGESRADHRRRGQKIERIAHSLVELQPAVAFIGGAPLAQTNGLPARSPSMR
jgi:hypothetical protein